MTTYSYSYSISHDFCDGDALPAESTTISSLDSDQFYKLCPGSHHTSIDKQEDGDGQTTTTYAPLGQPRCGDGTNYSFLVSRPPSPQEEEEEQQQQQQQQEGHEKKILIELTGGGACWDELTCTLQRDFLTFPTWLSTFVGRSCTDEEFGNYLLCSKTVGGIDFSTYNSVWIPYCTQDVHLGDRMNNEAYGIQHVGAHNLHRTLQWVFTNFPNPSHIFLTGCSAGGTPLPVVYDIINSHYKSSMSTNEYEALRIDVMADSPVFLTPTYFLENYLPNWNIGTVMGLIGFDFDAHKTLESYPDDVMDYALGRSKEAHQFGYISHDVDPVSQTYYKLMNGGSLFRRDRRSLVTAANNDIHRRTNNDNNQSEKEDKEEEEEEEEEELQWWTKMNYSINQAMNAHDNFHAFVMEGSGHCYGSLGIALEYAGFEEWAFSIVQESTGIGSDSFSNSSVVPSTNISVSLTEPSDTISLEPEIGDPADGTMTNIASHHTASGFLASIYVLLSWRWLLYK